jgi:hypothetical protein
VPLPVNDDNFVRAETDRTFAALQADAGGVNTLLHHRAPAPLNHQTVIRMNRDTLYMSVMIVNEDHYINRVLHDAGSFELTIEEFETPYVLAAVRILVDPADPADVATVNALQDQFRLTARSAKPFVSPAYDEETLNATRQALLERGRAIKSFAHAFGKKDEVDPDLHLIATAGGWGGLPEQEAFYENVDLGLPVGEYQLTVRDVPVDAFWSISVYNADGYFEANDRNANTVNSITARPNDDGSVTVNFGGCNDDLPNCLPIMEGWNYAVRLYQPRPEILNGSWTFPSAAPRT